MGVVIHLKDPRMPRSRRTPPALSLVPAPNAEEHDEDKAIDLAPESFSERAWRAYDYEGRRLRATAKAEAAAGCSLATTDPRIIQPFRDEGPATPADGEITEEELLAIDRWANDAAAELRAGKRIRDAIDAANADAQAVADVPSDEEPPSDYGKRNLWGDRRPHSKVTDLNDAITTLEADTPTVDPRDTRARKGLVPLSSPAGGTSRRPALSSEQRARTARAPSRPIREAAPSSPATHNAPPPPPMPIPPSDPAEGRASTSVPGWGSKCVAPRTSGGSICGRTATKFGPDGRTLCVFHALKTSGAGATGVSSGAPSSPAGAPRSRQFPRAGAPEMRPAAMVATPHDPARPFDSADGGYPLPNGSHGKSGDKPGATYETREGSPPKQGSEPAAPPAFSRVAQLEARRAKGDLASPRYPEAVGSNPTPASEPPDERTAFGPAASGLVSFETPTGESAPASNGSTAGAPVDPGERDGAGTPRAGTPAAAPGGGLSASPPRPALEEMRAMGNEAIVAKVVDYLTQHGPTQLSAIEEACKPAAMARRAFGHMLEMAKRGGIVTVTGWARNARWSVAGGACPTPDRIAALVRKHDAKPVAKTNGNAPPHGVANEDAGIAGIPPPPLGGDDAIRAPLLAKRETHVRAIAKIDGILADLADI